MIYTNDIIKRRYDKKKKLNILLKAALFPFIIAIIAFTVYVCYSKLIIKENSVNIFGYRQYIVATGSMQPAYNVGDLIVVKETNKDNIKVNDVITFTLGSEDQTVTHRVTDIIEKDGKTYYETKGDNNPSKDTELVEFSQIKGKITYKIDNIGVLITKIVSGPIAAVVVIIAIVVYIHSNRREEKRIAREIARRRYNIPRYKREEAV